MPASSHTNQDSYAYGDSESDQRMMLDLAGHPVQSVVTEPGGFVAETHGLLAGQAPAAAKAIDDFGHGRGVPAEACRPAVRPICSSSFSRARKRASMAETLVANADGR